MSDSSTGQIVGGIAGAAVGFFSGGPVGAIQGFSIGYGLGGVIDPPPGPLIKAPRLDDLTFQTSTYGAPIPRLFGTVGLRGNVIYLENGQYKEVVTEEEEGKGGGGGATVETVEYFATFAVSLGEGSAGSVIRKIWLGGKLFYNAGSDDLATILQSNKNADGFTFYDGSQVDPDPRIESVVGVDNAESYEGTAYLIFYDLPLAEYGNGLQGAPVKVEITTGYDPQPRLVFSATAEADSEYFPPQVSTISADRTQVNKPQWDNSYPSLANFKFSYFEVDGSVGFREYSVVDPGLLPNGLNDEFRADTKGDDLLSEDMTGRSLVARYPFGGYQKREGTLVWSNAGELQTADGIHGSNYIGIGVSPLGGAYVVDSTHIRMMTQGGVEVASIPHGLALGASFGPHKLWYDDGFLYFGVGEPSSYFQVYDTELTEMVRDFSIDSSAALFDSSEFAVNDGVLTRCWLGQSPFEVKFERWDLFPTDANTQLLSDVVSSIMQGAGLQQSQIDVSGLDGLSVRGYLSTPTDARGALGPLGVAFTFDIVEQGYTLKAVVRGSVPSEIIPIGDLGASNFGDQQPSVLSHSREMDTQMPSRVYVEYLDQEREYDTGSQYADYPTSAVNERTESVAVVLTADEGAQLADKIINASWTERTKVAFTLPQKYLHLKESDVVSIDTGSGLVNVRINSRNESVNQLIEMTGSLSEPSVWTSSAKGYGGESPNESIDYISASSAELLDVPMILDSTDQSGFTVSMWGLLNWRGGSLFKSVDSGQTFQNIQTFVNSSPSADTYSALPDSDCFTIDRDSTLLISVTSGSFPAITEAQMMTGQNWCAYGADGRWELVRYSGADLQSDGRILLSNFVRGARGTEHYAGQHTVGDRIYLLGTNSNAFVAANIERLGVQNLYKSVTIGQSVTAIDSFPFTYRGVNLKPLSPVLLSGVFSSGDYTISATTRTRYSSSFWVTGNQPQNESALSYELDVLDGLNPVRTLVSASLDFLYTEAMQIEDFGEAQDSIDVSIYQISPVVGRGYPLSGTVSAGPPDYAVYNDATAIHDTVTNEGLTVESDVSFWHGAPSQPPVLSGKYYYEVTVDLRAGNGYAIGVSSGDDASITGNYIGSQANGWGYHGFDGNTFNSSASSGYGSSYTTGDVIGVAVDIDAGRIWFSKNGVWPTSDPSTGAGFAYDNLSGGIRPVVSFQNATSKATSNHGQSPMTYPVPSGFNEGFYG